MDKTLISVIVPIYQAEKYIERCARSLFEQSYENLEFVFCDDCSTDASIQILEAIIKEYPQRAGQIKIIRHESNRGSAVARNTLIANSKGVFLFWVDSDDWVETNAVELMVKKQSENDADIVTCRCYGHYGDTMKEYFDGGFNLDKDTLLEMILRGKCGSSVWRRLIRKSLYTDHNIKCLEGINGRDDFQLIVPLIYFSRKVDSIDAFLYHYDRTPHHSITYDSINNLTYQIHSMRSRLFIRDFFVGKDEHYVQIVSEELVRWAHKYMMHHYQHRNRNSYQIMVDYIEKIDRKYWKRIRWDNVIIRTMESNYCMMCMTYPIRSLRRKIFH
jgi:glycosyltransferase involved in cell wall biosynthesis